MAGNAQREGIAEGAGQIRERFLQLFEENFRFRVVCGMRDHKRYFAARGVFLEARVQIVAQSIRNGFLCLFESVHFLERVELLALDLQYGFNA